MPGRPSEGSQRLLLHCDDGKLYVLKMRPNPQGPDVPAYEVLAPIPYARFMVWRFWLPAAGR
jgi:hypothetical protein